MLVSFTDRAIAYLKAAEPVDQSEAVTLSRDDSPVLRPLTDGLLIAYAVDVGTSYQFVQYRHLDQDRSSEERLYEVGIRNLLKIASERELRVQPYQNIYAVLMGGDFEASLILLDQLWEDHFRQFVAGEYAIAVPARDILAFCDSTSAVGLIELRQLIERIHATGDHPISDRIYVRRQKRWTPRDA
jgi:uncharacterized protein YtpQ (UPF0354 family)